MANARLTALRLVGFKSFAERTLVEFGPGISAVVGPNGSGKSNLADALRWTLGEQGRMLRTRRSEDVIFAGSSSRRAIGMADVTLVIDNSDRLLPVDYGEVEIGRRLYRSGESEYLLNRQRIRLRDLVELLDAGNLADNAFLFIGQGMVDQALALRPEERRPLFEEAAGVRRHERRRRQAEAELVEAEANLDRLRDILAELRPQQKRLAAQAEQLQARRTAGLELAEGLLAAARARWMASSEIATRQHEQVERARAAADAALSALKSAEDESATLSLAIARRAETERTKRDALDGQRSQLTELRVALARVESQIASLTADAARLAVERTVIERRVSEAARILAATLHEPSGDLDLQLELIGRQLDELEPTQTPVDLARKLRARQAELEQQARRRGSVAAALEGATARFAELTGRLERAESERDEASAQARAAEAALAVGDEAAALARAESDRLGTARAAATQRAGETETELGALRTRIASLEAAVSGTDDGLARAARARGASLVGEGLEVDPRFRTAVSAALGAAATAYLVPEDAVPALAGRRGTLAVPVGRGRTSAPAAAAAEAALGAAHDLGGGRLVDAIRRDPQAEVSRLIEHILWVPDIAAGLALRPQLLDGWRTVTLAGDVIAADGLITLASGDSILELRAQHDSTLREASELAERLTTEQDVLDRIRRETVQAAERAAAAARAHDAARHDQRRADEQERVAQRRAEQLVRETDWERAQVERLSADLDAVDAVVNQMTLDVARLRASADEQADAAERGAARAERRSELRAQHDELRARREAQLASARAGEEARRRAEIGRSIDEARLVELETQEADTGQRLLDLVARRGELASDASATEALVAESAGSLDVLLAAGSDERTRLGAAERSAIEAREKLRRAESASRDAEIASMEARLQLDQTREQLLLELATIGADGLRVLRDGAGLSAQPIDEETSSAENMEELLGLVVAVWQAERSASDADSVPSTGKLSVLRRRFNELGAGNPYAVEEYAELRERLDGLDSQRVDMETAIDNTRELIASLSALINEQFRTTFAALEDAFERRFRELFGGGDAELSLTMPDDISATGIEIHARPPGKKRQPLSMLSGGERALTAVSLLLAMLEVRPVPFCVLDEVDAALDEANVGRFSKALRGLAEQTQFIVITHNRGTIEGADALYGVTLGDDAVSRVVSLRLPDAKGNGNANGRQTQIDEDLTEAALA
jgi:chromosome segregation protein